MESIALSKPIHHWLRSIHIHYHPGPTTPLIDSLSAGMLSAFERLGHHVQHQADEHTNVVLTTADYGQVLNWRRSMMFTGRIQLKLKHVPTAVTLIHMTPAEFDDRIAYFEAALAKQPIDPQDFEYEGMAPEAPQVLIEQGKRGGPILSLLRQLQAQSKCIRILLVIGEDAPERIYHFDLVGAYPYTEYTGDDIAFYNDIVLRLVTYQSTAEVTDHEVLHPAIPRHNWQGLETVSAMRQAAQELGNRNFFTEMIKITDLAAVPAINDAIASQYSEGCFTTWEPSLEALIATITGSARPVDKDNITENDLAVIVGVRPGGSGAQVRHVEGKQNDPPSSEAVEMMDMDSVLPAIEWKGDQVPVIRSKLHGHRGVSAYDPSLVEFVPLDEPYYHYLVSCATEAQARGIKAAFARSESLQTPGDPRLVAFTVLPGHGVVITEKWVAGKQPFQLLWEYMDAGAIQIAARIPQGPMAYEDRAGMMWLVE